MYTVKELYKEEKTIKKVKGTEHNMKQTYVITDYNVKKNCKEIQTKQLQEVLDLCREDGGTVIIPKGRFYTGGLRMWSDTTLYLEEGAELYGSDNCEDYAIFEFPEGIEVRSDMELITQYYVNNPRKYTEKFWKNYHRAILSVYGGKNISIIGEKDSVIDGANCYDADGEEGYRGPHAIYMTCCDNVFLKGYTIQNSGNFLHEINNSTNIKMNRVTCLGGSDGAHLHCSKNIEIWECLFKTGDDCIAGINMENLHVHHCVLNTSCNLFRMGGVHLLVENCYAYGPGYYPHRSTIVKGKNDYLPREEGRHNMICVLNYFASTNYPYEASKDIVFRNCVIENAHEMLFYRADDDSFAGTLQNGTYLCELTLENVRFIDLHHSSEVEASPEEPLIVRLKNVSADFCEGIENTGVFDGADPNTHIILE